MRAENFRDVQYRKVKQTHLEVDSILTAKSINEITKINLRIFYNIKIKIHKTKALYLILKADHKSITFLDK